MLERLGAWIARRRWSVLAAAAALTVVGAVSGIGIHSQLIAGGFDDPNSEYVRAGAVLEDRFDLGAPNIVLLVQAKNGSVDDADMVKVGRELTRRLREQPHVAGAESYWTTAFVPLRSHDGREAVIVGHVDSANNDVVDRTQPIVDEFTIDTPQYSVSVGGPGAFLADAAQQTQKDYVRAELLAIPIVLILLLLVYRSVAAAVLPLVVGGFSVIVTYLVLRVGAHITDITVFSLNIVTALGLGLGIDYSLFVVSRFREELAAGHSTNEAVVNTVKSAGRTVAFSALALAMSLSALLLFPGAFAKSFALAGTAVVALAALGAVIALPALLAVLGPRVEWGTLPPYRGKVPTGKGWYRIAKTMMRRPIAVIVGVVLVLVILGLPFLRIALGVPDDRSLPPSAPSRMVSAEVRRSFDGREAEALSLIVTDLSGADTTGLDKYQADVSKVPGVARVDGPETSCTDGACQLPIDLVDPDLLEVNGGAAALLEKQRATYAVPDGDAVWYRVVLDVPPSGAQSEQAVQTIRDLPAPGTALITGQAVQNLDLRDSYLRRIPLALGWVALVTFVVLFLMFGSLLVPIKAIIMNILSLSATFGALVWIFQDGHLSGPLRFTPSGNLYVAIPVLMFCVAFGLSMDYEVFMLSRIKEEFDRSDDNEESIAVGLQRSGRIVTAAAVTMSVVMLAIGTSEISFIKMLGVGLALAILIDAFVIRCTLLPATMKLAGRWNWWAPHWMRRVHGRIGISERAPKPSEPERVP